MKNSFDEFYLMLTAAGFVFFFILLVFCFSDAGKQAQKEIMEKNQHLNCEIIMKK